MKKTELPRLVLLDSHAILHRAYHALPDFATAGGKPTGALYGLASMLIKITQELKPTYVIACRDLPGKTHRHDVYEAYKGTRMKADDALISQLVDAPKVFEAFGVPVYGVPGYEADDCIGTIVERMKNVDVETIIATGDMDTLQLVDGEKVKVFTLRKGLNDTVIYDEKAVHERYGFGPNRIVDYKGLRGDPSDNIKGIAGIGEKTATELLKAFDSIEGIYSAIEVDEKKLIEAGIKPRIVELLKAGKHDAEFSKKLATIHIEAPIDFVLPETPWKLDEHLDSIAALCEAFEFKLLKERVKTVLKKTEKGTAALAATGGLFAETAPPKRNIDAKLLKETALKLWLLRSDTTSPSEEDILRFAHTEDFETARVKIDAELRATKKLAELYETIEQPLMSVVDAMNAAGVTVDLVYLKTLSKEYSAELARIAQQIYGHAGHEFNINSPKQLGDVLYDELHISLPRQKKTAGGARTTREEELLKMSDQHPVIADVLAYRELQKLLSTYIDAIPQLVSTDGRLHPTFLQAGTTTGRMGCEAPNLQNIPVKSENGKRIRRAFVAQKGSALVALDYSQIELRIAAGLSQDSVLVAAFKKGEDIHAAVAARVFGVTQDAVTSEQRRRAKVINFGILYGMGVNALRQSLGEGVTRDEAQQFLDGYFENFKGVASWIASIKQETARRGFTETLFGRRRYFPGFDSAMPNVRAQAERMAVNAPIQGTQSDIVKLAMVEADKLIQKKKWTNDVRLILQVHDELIYEVSESLAQTVGKEIKKVMESVAPRTQLADVPILTEMEIGKTWADI